MKTYNMRKKILATLFFINITIILNASSLQNLQTSQSIELYEELILENDTNAMHKLALLYIKAKGVKKNIPKAYLLLRKASLLENKDATYTLGKLYLSKKTTYYDRTKAYNTFVNLAKQNHAKSQLMLGRFFLNGTTVDKDYEKALYYFKEASKQKEYASNCFIAYMYARGKGVFPNFGRAHVFAKDEYLKGNKLCVKVWKDYNLKKYPNDKGWNIGTYNKPVK